ncbi:galactose-1-phosphate uridylyltransferase [Parvularcula sp. ZS-1/3]|uniref:Galactose-1-phosphate uridylyltransferase n=1 Tax=Parvularcula mediterranea TaxID=2732508 RepID=A0A7Y3RLB7_9PROT|nr:galactose-1-phosphate uridylyltransferase [Parvularcula mediterranea]NNU16214.1 galactose-1-phosphate uridylyltransferase [Parvularcula mediterranea]
MAQNDIIAEVGGQSVFRRHHIKADGRDLRLYGYSAHELPVVAEMDDDVAKGGELRWHPFRREWNVYAAHRQNRTFKPSAADDPLAPTKPGGAATEIPFEDFEVAVFGNKFTSLHPEAPAPTTPPSTETDRAFGACDVVVYTADQTGDLHSVGQDRRRLLLAAWVDRYEALFSEGCRFVMPFESRGEEVGVTLHHPHGQIYAFGKVPHVHQLMAEAYADGFSLETSLPTWSDYVVAEAGNVAAFCPPFARFPYETWVTSRRRVAGPWDFSEEEADGFAALLGDMTRRYDTFFGRDTAYMLTLHASPVGSEDSFHFTAQFYPILRAPGRVKFLASVEQGTGVFTVDVMPETAARTLRDQ